MMHQMGSILLRSKINQVTFSSFKIIILVNRNSFTNYEYELIKYNNMNFIHMYSETE